VVTVVGLAGRRNSNALCMGSNICRALGNLRDCDEYQRRPSDSLREIKSPASADARRGRGNFKGAAGAASISTPRGGPTSKRRFTGGCKWNRALNRDHASDWSQSRRLSVRNAERASVSQKRLWMFAGIFSFGFFDASADRSSGTKNGYRRTPMATGLDPMKLKQEQSPIVCDDCNVPVSFRAYVQDRGTGKLVRICACPNCARLILDDDQQAARR
jgi:hypothetical protein